MMHIVLRILVGLMLEGAGMIAIKHDKK